VGHDSPKGARRRGDFLPERAVVGRAVGARVWLPRSRAREMWCGDEKEEKGGEGL
jgi:hypothetical protein